MESKKLARTIGRVSISCAVIDRQVQGSNKDLEGCDKNAIAEFGQRSIEVGMADIIQINLIFDGRQTITAIDLVKVPDSLSGGLKQ